MRYRIILHCGIIHTRTTCSWPIPRSGNPWSQRREMLQEKAREVCEWGTDAPEAEEADIVKEFEAEGMNVTELTEEELDAFQESISGMKQEFIKKYGEKACEAFDIEEE